MDIQTWNKGGYAKEGLTRERVERIHSRTADHKGRIQTGEAGKQLLRRKLEKQNYYLRNKGTNG